MRIRSWTSWVRTSLESFITFNPTVCSSVKLIGSSCCAVFIASNRQRQPPWTTRFHQMSPQLAICRARCAARVSHNYRDRDWEYLLVKLWLHFNSGFKLKPQPELLDPRNATAAAKRHEIVRRKQLRPCFVWTLIECQISQTLKRVSE